MITGFFPVFVLSFFVLAIFYQEAGLDTRISNLVTLVLAYIAFIPSFRDALLPVPYLTFSDYILGFNFAACLVCLLHSVLLKSYQNTWGDDIIAIVT